MWIWRASRQAETADPDGRRQGKRTWSGVPAVLASALFLYFCFPPAPGTMAYAQDPVSPMGAFATDPDAPIEIEADQLDVQQDRETATFIGNVVATQGAVKLRANRVKVAYAQATKTGTSGAKSGGTQITQINAMGDVHVTARNDQSADGEWAIYEVGNRQITMGDKVLLRQGGNVIRGTKLLIDLNTGRSRVDGAPSAADNKNGGNGRVKGLFLPASP